jgi:HAD superfamily hydrolase (TIGR01490 family)
MSALRLICFDLDHTLLDGDSDVLWCDFLIGHGLLDRAGFEARSTAMDAGYRAGSVSPADYCGFYVSTLAGRTPAQWQPLREAFVREIVAPRLKPAGRRLVQRHLSEAALVVMTTATNRFITELTARELGIEHVIATECEIGPDGCFTGRPAGVLNMREGKVARLDAWLAARGLDRGSIHSTACSDSINDLPLLEAVSAPVAVDADERLAAVAAARGWACLSLR